MSIKKWILPVLLVVILGGYIAYKQFFSAPAINNSQSSAGQETINANPGNGQQNPPANPPATQTGYKDGQYTGIVASSVYGDTQVQITITGGKITDIEMLQTPTGPGHTAQLVASSFPVLKSEAIAAQSAKVNIVSGATQNSEAFSQSLASALSQAS